MNKEVISNQQAISMIILFMSGTSTIFMVALSAEGDFWLAIILSVILACIMGAIFAYLHAIFPKKNLFDICEDCFGKIMGKGICILFSYFAFEEAVAVFTNAKQFITETTMPETPQIITIIPIVILCIWVVKEGIEVIGKCANFFIIIFIILIFTMVLLLIPQIDLDNFGPVLYKGINPVLKGTLSAFAFPFGEIVMFTMVFSNFRIKKSAYKVYIGGLVISGIISLLTSIATISILGIDIATTSYFPVFNAASGIAIGDFIQRLEIFAAVIGVVGSFFKNSILLLAVCKGISKIFNLSNYRLIIMPVALLMINFSYFYYDSRMEFVEYNMDVWTYYAIIFEVFIPIMLLLFAIMKKKSFKK
ncbi:GerAB/ArcD/ProY family transporter [Crassaminicella thermophila]|uniref:GerAB/ArcD/ProY family transporter n=1 Tax=Crassaminicella thermophila TaxID=2599308 RepID=A0A5C0SB14_CRATE|nr:endospore germination permease [Crassaminicella thermophila]QEK11240.1 GerAB/ArcD/ProY family transporter [Crassaminicella thermophila]